jgi:ribonuclease HI
MDSELVVDQVNGLSAVRQAHLIELHSVASGLVDLFKNIRISWVPREMNVEADRLVRDALGAPDLSGRPRALSDKDATSVVDMSTFATT